MGSPPIVHFRLLGQGHMACSPSNQNGKANCPSYTEHAWEASCKNCQRTDAWREAMRKAPESVRTELVDPTLPYTRPRNRFLDAVETGAELLRAKVEKPT